MFRNVKPQFLIVEIGHIHFNEFDLLLINVVCLIWVLIFHWLSNVSRLEVQQLNFIQM